MRVCIKLKQLAILQKLIGWSVVIMSARSRLEMPCIVFGCIVGIMLNEFADVWYKLVCKYEHVIEKECLKRTAIQSTQKSIQDYCKTDWRKSK